MKAFAKFHLTGESHQKTPGVPSIRLCDKFAVSLFLGMTAPVVAFVAASVFETPGKTTCAETAAGCVGVALYLAFCEFWVAPRDRHGFRANWPTLIASIIPLLLAAVAWSPRFQGFFCSYPAASGAWPAP